MEIITVLIPLHYMRMKLSDARLGSILGCTVLWSLPLASPHIIFPRCASWKFQWSLQTDYCVNCFWVCLPQWTVSCLMPEIAHLGPGTCASGSSRRSVTTSCWENPIKSSHNIQVTWWHELWPPFLSNHHQNYHGSLLTSLHSPSSLSHLTSTTLLCS